MCEGTGEIKFGLFGRQRGLVGSVSGGFLGETGGLGLWGGWEAEFLNVNTVMTVCLEIIMQI